MMEMDSEEDDFDRENELIALYAFVDELKEALDLKALENTHLSKRVKGLTAAVQTLTESNTEKQTLIFDLEESISNLENEVVDIQATRRRKEEEIKSLKAFLGAIHKQKVEIDDMTREEQKHLLIALKEENKMLLKQNTKNQRLIDHFDEQINNRDSEILDLNMKVKLLSLELEKEKDMDLSNGTIELKAVTLMERSPKSKSLSPVPRKSRSGEGKKNLTKSPSKTSESPRRQMEKKQTWTDEKKHISPFQIEGSNYDDIVQSRASSSRKDAEFSLSRFDEMECAKVAEESFSYENFMLEVNRDESKDTNVNTDGSRTEKYGKYAKDRGVDSDMLGRHKLFQVPTSAAPTANSNLNPNLRADSQDKMFHILARPREKGADPDPSSNPNPSSEYLHSYSGVPSENQLGARAPLWQDSAAPPSSSSSSSSSPSSSMRRRSFDTSATGSGSWSRSGSGLGPLQLPEDDPSDDDDDDDEGEGVGLGGRRYDGTVDAALISPTSSSSTSTPTKSPVFGNFTTRKPNIQKKNAQMGVGNTDPDPNPDPKSTAIGERTPTKGPKARHKEGADDGYRNRDRDRDRDQDNEIMKSNPNPKTGVRGFRQPKRQSSAHHTTP